MNPKGHLAYQMGGTFVREQKLEPSQSVLIEDSSNEAPFEA